MRALRFLFLALMTACAVQVVIAQTNAGTYADGNNPSGPYDPSRASQVWNIDPLTGAVTLKIPIFVMPNPGLGPPIPYILEYNSSSTLVLSGGIPQLPQNEDGTCYNCNATLLFTWSVPPPANPGAGPPGPWTTSGPSISHTLTTYDSPNTGGSCQTLGPYIYTDENGDAHDLNAATAVTSGLLAYNPCEDYENSLPSETSDGSFMLAQGNERSFSTAIGSITYKNGTTLAKGGLTDSNGNTSVPMFSSTYDPYSTTATASTVTTYTASGAAATWNIQTERKAVPAIKMPEPTTADLQSLGTTKYVVDQTSVPGEITEISSIGLPDSTSSYTFTYDPTYGTISKLTFPSGGYVRFVWAIRARGAATRSTLNGMSTLVATDAYVSTGSGSEAHWHYSYPNIVFSSSSLPSIQSTETDPLGNVTTYGGHFYQSSTLFLDGQYQIMKSNVTLTSNSGGLLRTIASGFSVHCSASPPSTTTIYNDVSPAMAQSVQYLCDTYGNVTEKDESDFYTGTTPVWARKTLTTYYWGSYPGYVSARILDKPYTVIVEDGSGTPLSETQYDYDQSTPAPHGNLVSEKNVPLFPPPAVALNGYQRRPTGTMLWESGHLKQILTGTPPLCRIRMDTSQQSRGP